METQPKTTKSKSSQTKEESKWAITVNGFTIRENTFYQVVPKPDPDAPQGFIDEGTTKVLDPRISDFVPNVFDSTMEAWDTGFYEESASIRNLKDKEERVALLNKIIVAPFEKLKGKGKLSQYSENKFWDEFRVDLHDGRLFDTSKITDLLDLYIAVLHGHLAPEDKRSLHVYKNAAYCIKDKDAVTNYKEQREFDISQATVKLDTVFDADKKKLVLISNYLSLGIDMHTTKMEAVLILNEYMREQTRGSQNTKMFLETYERANTEVGYAELDTFTLLTDAYKKGIVTKISGDFMFNGHELGTNLKDSARELLKDKGLLVELRKLIKE